MALISAADYAKLPSSIAKEKENFAYQAAHPETSSSKPQANDPGSAAYTGATAYTGGTGADRSWVADAYETSTPAADKNWNSLTKSQQEYWVSSGGKMAELGSANFMDRFKNLQPQAAPGSTTPTMAAGTQQGTVKDAQGNIIGSYLPGGGFAPATSQGSQQMPPTTGMAYTPTGGSMGNNYGIGAMEGAQFGYPAMPQQSSGTSATGTAFPVKSAADIAAEAKARTDALLAKQTTIAGQTKQGFQTAFDRSAATTKDDRTLQDSAFQRNTNPFSGGTDYKAAMIGRERETTDRQASQDLQSRLANVDLSLADYANATEAQRMQMEDQMTQAERAYGMQVDQLALQRQGQALGQFNADRSFNYGVGQDQIKNGQWSQTFNQNQSNADRTFNAGRQDVAYNQGQDLITNNRNAANDAATYTANYTSPQTSAIMQKIAANSSSWFNATPSERTRLAAENQSLGASIGAKQDESGNWIMPQPQRTVAGMQLDSQAKEVTYNHARDSVKDDQWKQTFDYNKQQNDIQQSAQYAGLYNGQPTMQKIMQDATIQNMTTDDLRAAASEARTAGNNQLAKRMEIWDRTGKAPAGIPGVPEGTPLGGKKSTALTAENYSKFLDGVAKYETDPDTKAKKLSNAQAVEDAILLSGADDYEQYKMYNRMGIPWTDPIPQAPGKQ